MATIEKRNGKYRVKVRLKGVTKSETFALKSDAVAWAARTEAAILDGVQGNAPKSLYFADLLTRYRDEITPTKRGNRAETYRLNRALRSDLADIKVSDLRPHHFAQWRDNRKKKYKRPLSDVSLKHYRPSVKWRLKNGGFCRQILYCKSDGW